LNGPLQVIILLFSQIFENVNFSLQIIWSFSKDFSIESTRPLRVGQAWIIPEDQEHIVIQDLPLHDGDDSFDSILTIANTTAEDAGQYTCSVVSFPPEQRLSALVYFDVSFISDDSFLDPLKLDEGIGGAKEDHHLKEEDQKDAEDDKLVTYQDDSAADELSKIEELLSPDPENTKIEEEQIDVVPEDDKIIEDLQDQHQTGKHSDHDVSSEDGQVNEDQSSDQQDVTSEDDVDPEGDPFQIEEVPDIDVSSENVQLDVEFPEDDKLKLEDLQDDSIIEDDSTIEDQLTTESKDDKLKLENQPEADVRDRPEVDGVEVGDDQLEDEKKMAISSSCHPLHSIPLLISMILALTRTINTFQS